MHQPKQSSWIPSPSGRWTGAWVTLTLTALFAVLSWVSFEPIDAMGKRIYDTYFTLRGPLPVPDSVVVAAIDEASIRKLGHWPWTRARLAELVRRLDHAGAALIVFDIVWSEPQQGDDELAAAMAASGRTILPLAFSFEDSERPPVRDPDLHRSAFVAVEQAERFARHAPIHTNGLLPPIPALRNAAQALGSIQVFPDNDGIFRWEPLLLEYDGSLYPSLGLISAASYLGRWVDDLTVVATAGVHLDSERYVPTDTWGRTLIPYYGAGGSFSYYSVADVFSGTVGKEQLAGKVVVVGATAVGLHDQISTPLAALMPGVEKQATMIAALIEGRSLDRAPRWVELLALIAIGILVAGATTRSGIWWGFTTTVLIFFSTLAAGYVLFRYAGVWFDASYILATLLSALILVSAYKYIAEERLARRIKGLFSSYVHEGIVEELIRNPESARLGGGRRQVTILFSDIRGFTSFSENHSPDQVVARLNEYYSAMAEVIFRRKGTLDKFIGDAIMAFWGAPIKQEDHSVRAVLCALDMIDRLKGLEADWQARGEQPFRCGIGIDSGEVLVGNIGAEGKKMDYTVIGDHVNLASRVEGLTKHYGSALLITEHVVDELSAQTDTALAEVSIEAVGEATVHGRTQPVGIYRCCRKTGDGTSSSDGDPVIGPG